MNFTIKDLLLHIFHGGIILVCILYIIMMHGDYYYDVINFIKEGKNLEIILSGTLFLFLSYCLGIMLDPLADWVDRIIFKYIFTYPSYYLLNRKKGKWGLTLAHYNIVNDILINDVILNEFQEDSENASNVNTRKDKLKDPKNALFLFQYAKNRAFADYTDYQVQRVEAYFRLSAFFRTFPLTAFFCLLLLMMFLYSHVNLWILIGVFIIVSVLAELANYRYRIYYCRMVLGIMYSPVKVEK